jgi:hypothetical protein
MHSGRSNNDQGEAYDDVSGLAPVAVRLRLLSFEPRPRATVRAYSDEPGSARPFEDPNFPRLRHEPAGGSYREREQANPSFS